MSLPANQHTRQAKTIKHHPHPKCTDTHHFVQPENSHTNITVNIQDQFPTNAHDKNTIRH
jgi:hypothetical protein